MKIVIDTNVLVSGVISPNGPPAEVLRAVLRGHARVCYDERIVYEYRDVLTRGKFAFDADTVEELLWFLEACGDRVLAEPLAIALPDPADRMFLEVACTAGADFLVTGNLRHFSKHAWAGCTVVTPRDFVDHPT